MFLRASLQRRALANRVGAADNVPMTFAPLGDSAVVVTMGSDLSEAVLASVRELTAAFSRQLPPGCVDVVPAYATVTVFYEPAAFAGLEISPYERVCQLIGERATRMERGRGGLVKLRFDERRTGEGAHSVELPVCYGGEFGPDLADVSRHTGLGEADVIAKHSGATYVVHAVGFTPGFPYLGGLPEILHTPRRNSPRIKVPAGSVGIGWTQTGVYPLESPGGWNLIGRTPVKLFRPNETDAALLRVGDKVTFRVITPEEFRAWK